MAENIGIVIKTEPENYATIIANRKGPCGGCRPNHGGCHSCLEGASKVESRVVNPVDARVGDLVRVHLSTSRLFAGAAILYLLPVFGLMAGAAAGTSLLTVLGLAEMSGAIIGAMLGLGFSVTAVYLLDKSNGVRNRIMPTITKVLTSKNGDQLEKKDSCCG
ncbi:MAG: SoxR reducing system RseC family protein [Proteobacteria bacterium]|nr:SoxR reducing system RseC family protein [Pseudomonadota bacterium]MBU4470592.1 SoxR reducing system RseC family protein [Pseudomonadota bacterium]MCG2751427.1 SoxR reducing system RseC family protein [Desulfobacteraceae bacterium]